MRLGGRGLYTNGWALMAVIAVLATLGCSEGSNGTGNIPPENDGGTQTEGGNSGNTEAGGGGNPDGNGDAGSSGDASSGSCQGTPALDLAGFDPCMKEDCTNAVCIPTGVVPEDQRDRLTACDDSTTCVPNELAGTGPKFVPKKCESVGGFPGRCLSTCIPQIQQQQDFLQQKSCKDGQLCAPCHHPITGEDTGACAATACDQPPATVHTFQECCNGTSLCVPSRLVPEGQKDSLGKAGCQDGQLCAPKVALDDEGNTVKPPTCTSLAGAPGRCLPTCIPEVKAQAEQLPQASCQDGHKCAPCFDPRTGEETAACTIGDDSPPMQCESGPNLDTDCTFKDCFVCTAEGTQADTEDGMCVPEDLVGDSNRNRLSQNGCGDGFLCAPSVIAKDQENGNFKRCMAQIAPFPAVPGACVPGCFPDMGQRGFLTGEPCDKTNYLCAPCVSPLDNSCTGACQNTPDSCGGGGGGDAGTGGGDAGI